MDIFTADYDRRTLGESYGQVHEGSSALTSGLDLRGTDALHSRGL